MERMVLMIEICSAVILWVKKSLPVSKPLAWMAMKGSLTIQPTRLMKQTVTIMRQQRDMI